MGHTKKTYLDKINDAKEAGITLPSFEKMNDVTGVYGFFAKNNDEEICFYVGKAVNLISRMLSSSNGHIYQYLYNNSNKLVPESIKKYRNKDYLIEVKILHIVDYHDTSFQRASHRLALAELQQIVHYQILGQCLEQMPEGSTKADERFFDQHYRISELLENNVMDSRSDILKQQYNLQQHPEGGCFAEVYTAPFEKDGRPLAGSIYFLLDKDEISHFHQIDCDEIWYYHEGCGMKVTVLGPNGKEEFLLGNDVEKGQRAMVVIPKGVIFGAENLSNDGFTFVSCATTPNFTYEGFRLVNKDEIKKDWAEYYDEVEYLAY